jgi:hypothetical protein
MRKLLLSSTALATVAALTAGAAVADVSISAATEWSYTSRSSQVTVADGTFFGQDSEIAFNFSNKTDSGLTIAHTVELRSDDGDTAIDESSFSISGGFGKVILGNNDNVMDNYGFEAEDAVTEQSSTTHTNGSIGGGNGPIMGDGDANKIAYHLPAMGGFTAGFSFADSGVSETGANAGTDTTAVGFAYTMDAGGNTLTLAGAQGTTEATTTDADSQNISAKVVAGNMTVIVANSTYQADDEDRNSVGAGVSYTLPNGMVLGAYTFKTEDDLDAGEEYSKSGMEVMYTIAAGLKAIVNVDDYDYKIGTETAATADSGTISKLTIQAAF